MRYGWRLIYLVAITICGGCGSGHNTTVGLKGEVTFDGKVIENGTIDFIPVEGTPGSSVVGTIANGRYAVAAAHGLLLDGTYQVRITGLRKTGRMVRNRLAPGGQPVEVSENFIPPIYNSESTLKVRIAELPNKSKVDFQLGRTATATPH